MPTILIKDVPNEVYRTLRAQAANAGKSLQQYLLDVVYRQADVVTIEEMMGRKRVEAVAYGEVDLDRQAIVEIVRSDRESH
ncbi:FitA-like ribbon-helix-helix domain-containing protein [Candidatus Poriferisocius sp.]|uniref:FitA-like ribbon-helix-helix domain-containing protein n=1 Tax=Candidatus Poriferisocius sp. TaxID=3101276 RepID=UPI003B59F1BF